MSGDGVAVVEHGLAGEWHELESGFRLERVVEPQPPADMMDLPEMRDELRRPMMLLVSAVKEAADGSSTGGKNNDNHE